MNDSKDMSLCSAARYGNIQVIMDLLRKEPTYIKARNKDGRTPLHLVGYVEVVRIMIEKGADKEAVNNDGRTSLNLAAKYGHSESSQRYC